MNRCAAGFETVADPETQLCDDPAEIEPHQESQGLRHQERQDLVLEYEDKIVDRDVDAQDQQRESEDVESHHWQHLVLVVLD